MGIFKSISSLVTFTDAYVSYVIPKTGYDESTKNYFVTVTVCVVIPKPGTFNFEVETKLNGLNVPAIFKVINILFIVTICKLFVNHAGYFCRCIHE